MKEKDPKLILSVGIVAGWYALIFNSDLPGWIMIPGGLLVGWFALSRVINHFLGKRLPYSRRQWQRLIDIGDQSLVNDVYAYRHPEHLGQGLSVATYNGRLAKEYWFFHWVTEPSPDDPSVATVIEKKFFVNRKRVLVSRHITGGRIQYGEFQQQEKLPDQRRPTAAEMRPAGHELDELADWFANAEPVTCPTSR